MTVAKDASVCPRLSISWRAPRPAFSSRFRVVRGALPGNRRIGRELPSLVLRSGKIANQQGCCVSESSARLDNSDEHLARKGRLDDRVRRGWCPHSDWSAPRSTLLGRYF